ncbi:MAG: archease [Minisyncoccia bacterium]
MYEYLPHTADLKIRIKGNNLEDIFVESLKALNNFLDPEKGDKKIEKNIELSSKDLILLYIDFLSEILSLTYTEKMVFDIKEIKIVKNEEITLEAILNGTEYKSLKKDIKAITYHQAKIEKEDDKYISEFIIDV